MKISEKIFGVNTNFQRKKYNILKNNKINLQYIIFSVD
jgi:hypothetical protein